MRKTRFSLTAMVVATVLLVSYSAAEEKKAQAKLGEKAPAFTLQDQNGQTVSLSDFQGKVVVLEWLNPDCPFVVRHYNEKTMKTLSGKYDDQEVVWLAINSSHDLKNQASKEWIEKHNLSYPILNDASGDTGRAYGAQTTPHMYIIDTEGKLVYMGGIDNDPQGSKKDQRVNYVEKALAEVINGESVGTAESRPYGCAVKYSR